jgi:glucuronosyltransferase
LDSAEHGVIYFSLGSVVKSSKMPRETVSLLLSELAKLKQTVLWKWEDDQLPNLPKNVKVKKWFPQNDILGIHANIKTFNISIISISNKFLFYFFEGGHSRI